LIWGAWEKTGSCGGLQEEGSFGFLPQTCCSCCQPLAFPARADISLPVANGAAAAVSLPSFRSGNALHLHLRLHLHLHLHLLALQIQLGAVPHHPGALQILADVPLILLSHCQE